MKDLGNEMKDFREPLDEKSISNAKKVRITSKKSYNKIIIIGVALIVALIAIILL